MSGDLLDDPLADLKAIVLELKAGDVLWLTYPGIISPDAHENIRRSLRPYLPESVRVVIGEEGLTPTAVLR